MQIIISQLFENSIQHPEICMQITKKYQKFVCTRERDIKIAHTANVNFMQNMEKWKRKHRNVDTGGRGCYTQLDMYVQITGT